MKKLTLITSSLILIAIFSLGTFAQNYSKLSDFPEEIKKSKPFKRFEWFFQQRAFPYDTVPYYYANNAVVAELKKIADQESKSKNQIIWNPKGPFGFPDELPHWGIVNGRVRAVAVHPNDPLIVYIGTASGGLWKTIDGGDNWMDIGQGLESFSWGAIAIDPNNPDVIYAGSGEPRYVLSTFFFGGKGLYKSEDGGDSWEIITDDFGPFTHFADIEISPFDSDILFATLTSGSYNLGSSMANEGIWKSTNAGTNWNKTLDLAFACEVMFHPDSANLTYASIGGQQDVSGFYISKDMGETWTASSNGIQDSTKISRMVFDISQSNSDIFYAVAYEPDSGNVWWGAYTNAYKSIDGGLNWEQISEGVGLGGNWGGWYDQGFYDLCIAVDPLNSDHVFIGNVELHETTDGQNFSPVRIPGGSNAGGSIAHVDYHSLVYAPSDPNYFYIGGDGGIYQSTDGCITAVSKSNGLEISQCYRIGSHPTNANKIIAGLQDNGTILTSDGGDSWIMVYGNDGMECFFDYQNPDTVYASYYHGKILRSTNGGNSFSFFASVNGGWVTPFFLHPFGHDTLYAANHNIIKNGQPITYGLSPAMINTMAQSRVNPNNMILAGFDEERYWIVPSDTIPVMTSSDGGYNWTNVTGNIPGEKRWISRVITHPNQENTMYVVRCGFSEGNKIYKTTDFGESWTNVSGDLPDIPCNDLFIDPEKTDHYYVATDLGVYYSENEGVNWTYEGEGIPFVPVLDFDYVKIDGIRYLRIGTHGRSIYETILPNYCLPEGITFSTQEEIDNFQLNYPGCNEIEGDVEIDGVDITNLNGLNAITEIYGNLKIGSIDLGTSLIDLSGLDNLISIGGNVEIIHNDSLISLTGLENIMNIYGSLKIGIPYYPTYHQGNPLLIDLTGLDNLVSIGEDLVIWGNDNLINFSGLNALALISGDVSICENDSLTNLSGLESLTSIHGNMQIGEFSGSPNGLYPNLSLESLSGLNNLDSIAGSLQIELNPNLQNLQGLNNLNFIGDGFIVSSNGALTTLAGIDSLPWIGGGFEILNNSNLNSLSGANSLNYIGGELNIYGNLALTSLTGLDSIEPASITDLKIIGNSSLYDCDIWPICQYLADSGATAEIHNNETECNSSEEVLEHCLTEIEEYASTDKLNIYPNPLGSNTLITYTLGNNSSVTLKILDLSGRLVVSLVNEYQGKGEQRIVFNTEGLKPGVYFCTIITNEGKQTKKIIKL